MRQSLISLTHVAGETRMVLTNAGGYYRCEATSAGETYAVSVSAKRYSFAPQIINVFEEIENLNFAAQ
ncbi:MAG: hypothetical protein M3209_10770 [Acidobacteriota bacterium]|nr:hypothetical protein [Acidobacteriota bacterium]